jgi:acetyltransferase-like isoleucine patch superfamily enzyme
MSTHSGSWLLAPARMIQLVLDECRGLAVFMIRSWPNTPFGHWLRRVYWRRRTGVRKIFVGRGADLGDCRLLVLGENIEFGEDVEFVVDGPPVGHPVYIGSNLLVARSVYLRSSNHRFDDATRLIMEQGHVSKAIEYQGATYSVVIEGDNWIGANVIILSGARIGVGCVIAAGAVVAGEIPPYAIAGGCPARVIGFRKSQAAGATETGRDPSHSHAVDPTGS